MLKTAIDDFARIRRLGEPVVSPDGKKAALLVNTVDMENDRYRNDIWLYEDGRMRRLTAGGDASKPFWEDDETILFAADRAGEAKEGEQITVYNRISIRGGEAERAFRVPFKASNLTAYRDGKYIVTGLYDNAAEEKKEERGYTVFDELPFWFNGRGVINKLRTRLYVIDPSADTQEPLTEPLFDVHGFAYSSETDMLAYWGCAFEHRNPQKDCLFFRSMAAGTVTEVPLENKYDVSGGVFALGTFVFLASDGAKMGTSENEKVYTADIATGAFRELLAPDVTFGGDVGSDVHTGGRSMAGTAEALIHIETIGYTSHICALDGNGIRVLTPGTNAVDAIGVGAEGVFFTGMEENGLQELYRLDREGSIAKLSAFNADYLAEHELSAPKHFTFTDRDGVEIDGWIMEPVGHVPGTKAPAVLDVHGGPRGVYGDVYFHEMQYWAAQGYYVFFSNPRGGSGKGDAFADILGDNYGVRDYNDLMEFTDRVLERTPDIDPARVAMTGGSYGGFMANWIIGHTDRFACVASQRSISNYISKCLTTDIGYYHNLSAIQADPWTNPAKMWEHSPLKYADRVKTPTLFIQSDEDYRCWMGDAVQMLQALLMHDVPAKMCLFHGENHELSRNGKPKNRVGRLKEITAWFDCWCGEKK